MSELWRNLSANLASFLAPGLVLLLLGIQVAFGLRGFDRPDDSLLYVLQVPGVLLGWGGVALLLPLLAWMILDWWGYDLNGFALKGLGSAVLGVAVGAMFGLSGGGFADGVFTGGVASGGLVGAGLATVLAGTVGNTMAWVLLLLMAAPACVLALSLQRGAPRTGKSAAAPAPSRPKDAASETTASAATGSAAGSEKSRVARILSFLTGRSALPKDQAWYPQQRFDAGGNEVPMQFRRARDVSGVRFADAAQDDDGPGGSGQKDGHEGEAAEEAGLQDPAETQAPLAHEEAPSASDLLTGSVSSSSVSSSSVPAGEERLPTIPELLAGNFSGSRAGNSNRKGPDAGGEDPSGGPREPADGLPEEGPIHVDGSGRPTRAPPPEAPTRPEAGETAAATPATGTRPGTQPPLPFARPEPGMSPVTPAPEPSLPSGIRYADEPTPSQMGAAAGSSALASTHAGASHAGAPTDDLKAEDQLSQAVRDAVRGPTLAAGDAKGQASARRIRKTLRQSVASLRNDGTSERHLAKLEAMGLFDTLEVPPANQASAEGPPSGAVPDATPGAASGGGSAAAGAKKPAGGSRIAGQAGATTTTAVKSTKTATPLKKGTPTGKAASGKKAARKSTTRKKAARKSSPRKKAARKKAAGTRSPRPPAADGLPPKGPGPQAAGSRPTRRRTESTATAERRLLLEGLRLERLDPLFRRCVEAALDQGAASPVLLTRRLGLPFPRAEALIERLVSTGVLRAHTDGGSHPLDISRQEWDSI